MNQALVQYTKFKGKNSNLTDAVEQARERHAEECHVRIAKRMNGADKNFKNGPAPGFPAVAVAS